MNNRVSATDVWNAAVLMTLDRRKIKPAKLRSELGNRGSFSTICKHLDHFRLTNSVSRGDVPKAFANSVRKKHNVSPELLDEIHRLAHELTQATLACQGQKKKARLLADENLELRAQLSEQEAQTQKALHVLDRLKAHARPKGPRGAQR